MDSNSLHYSASLKATRKERMKHDKVIYYILNESKLYKHRKCLKLQHFSVISFARVWLKIEKVVI